MSDPAPTDLLKESTAKLTEFVNWLAELVWTKNWVALLVLLDVAAFFFLRPESGILIALFKLKLPSWYAPVFWLVVGAIFLGALVVAIRARPRPLKLDAGDAGNRQAIKGLRSFGVEDAEIFAKLQRNQVVQDCLESIARQEFRFGILVAESGCGKSSLLQAGVVPRLSKPEASLRAVYVKFSDRPPIETVRASLVEQLGIPPERVEQADFLALLAIAVELAGKPILLLFDQFEQFFVHQPNDDDRHPFVQALTQWYASSPPLPVKILVSIRADLQYELNALQQALGYILSRYEVFQLKRFDPEEATEILRVLAETEAIAFDAQFVKAVTRDEFTSAGGTVSPVDLQIFAEIVRKQKQQEQRAFSREAFQKLGGMDGLLNRYLEDTLEDLRLQGHSSLYQTALQVLLALTDRERNVRASTLTLDDLQGILIGTATPREIATAVTWLSASEVRLITPVERQQQSGYELAHERIIPALLRLAGKELKEADRANQLLERRTQEWIGNQRHPRYLFTWQDLWLLHRQRTHLTWGTSRRAKEQLLRQSWQRIYRALWALGIALALMVAGWCTWLTPPAQQRYAIWRLPQTSLNTPHDTRIAAATALAQTAQWEAAQAIADSMQADPYSRATALNDMATVAITLKDTARAQPLLKAALDSANIINNDGFKSDALRAIAASYGNLKDAKTASDGLKMMLDSANAIQDDVSKSYVLIEIANRYGKLNDPKTASDVLKKALDSANAIQNDLSKSYVLRAIVDSYIDLNDPKTANEVLKKALDSANAIQDDSSKSSALIEIAASYGRAKDVKTASDGLKKVLDSANAIKEDSYKSSALRAIADSYIDLNDPKTANEVLKKALDSANTIQDDYAKFDALWSIAASYGRAKDAKTASDGLKQALGIAKAIKDDSAKSYALREIAASYGNLKDSKIANDGLKKALDSANAIKKDEYKSSVLSAIAASYGNLKDSKIASDGLKTVLDSANAIKEDNYKSSVLSAIAASYITLKDWDQATALLQQASQIAAAIQGDKSQVLQPIVAIQCEIALGYFQQGQSTSARDLLNQALQTTEQIQDISSPGSENYKETALTAIAGVWVNLGDWRQANQAVGRCSSDSCRTVVWTGALTAAAEIQHPALKPPPPDDEETP